jgi:hypothetical protein
MERHARVPTGSANRSGGWNLFVLLAAAVHFSLVYTLNTSPFLNLSSFEAGQERAPFQYRALTAWIMALADRFIHLPHSIQAHLPPRLNQVHSFVLLGIVFFSIVVAVYATRYSMEHLTRDTQTSRWWALLVIFMSYFHYVMDFGHPCCTPFQLPYDLPSMAFFAAGIFLIITDRMPLFYLCFILATLNRESTVFLVVIYILYKSAMGVSPQLDRLRRVLPHVVALAAIWIAIRIFLHHMYPAAQMGGNHVGSFEIHVVDNIGYLLRPYYWASYLSMFGFSWLYIYANWGKISHPGIRRALLIGPLMLLAMYIVGVLSEIRIFGEIISLFAIALMLLLKKSVSTENCDQL